MPNRIILNISIIFIIILYHTESHHSILHYIKDLHILDHHFHQHLNHLIKLHCNILHHIKDLKHLHHNLHCKLHCIMLYHIMLSPSSCPSLYCILTNHNTSNVVILNISMISIIIVYQSNHITAYCIRLMTSIFSMIVFIISPIS